MKSITTLFLLLAALCLPGSLLCEVASGAPPDIMVSGFEAFGGRSENASWVLAQELARAFPKEVHAMQIPVLWGAPMKAISDVSTLPQVWIAFGEGTQQGCQIEVLAHNLRGRYPDNHGTKPVIPEIVKDAEPQLHQTAKLEGLAEALTQAGFPTIVSENAGRYICEEMLYSLLHMQKQHPEALRLVLFIHVPPMERYVLPAVIRKGEPPPKKQKVDPAWLQAFGTQLFASLRKLGLLTATAH